MSVPEVSARSNGIRMLRSSICERNAGRSLFGIYTWQDRQTASEGVHHLLWHDRFHPPRLHKKYGHLVCTLSGDWHHTMEDKPPAGPRAHMMRVMLIQNIAVDQRFANGTQGRLLHWHPGATESRRKALPAYCSELLVRFCKESALAKMEMMPGLFVFLGYKNGS